MVATRTGILGGTFDPPHLGHLVLAAAARRALGLDRVLFVPAGEPWRKQDREVTPAEARLRMLQAAVASLPWAEVSAVELERPGPSYSAETAQQLAVEGEGWWLILGADALSDLPHWHEPQTLLATLRLAVAGRDGLDDALEGVPEALLELVPDAADRIDRVPMPALRIASTDLRATVREGGATGHLVPQATRRVIDELGLYRA
jgi:nicotinate-nucleotide adenylyltransferase